MRFRITPVTDIRVQTGAPMLPGEGRQLTSFVFVDVAPAIAIANYVNVERTVLSETVEIPGGYRLSWSGQLAYNECANQRLEPLAPLALFLVVMMHYFHQQSLVEAAIAVGINTIAGLAVEPSILTMLYLDVARRNYQKRGQ